jgi:hypothetical protein
MVYKSGNVFVLRARFTETGFWMGSWIPKSKVQGIPSVASQLVPAGGHFRFVLPAGRYVLIDDDGGQRTVTTGAVTVSYVPWTNVLVEAGQTSWWEIPADPTACPPPYGRSSDPTPIDAYEPTT